MEGIINMKKFHDSIDEKLEEMSNKHGVTYWEAIESIVADIRKETQNA